MAKLWPMRMRIQNLALLFMSLAGLSQAYAASSVERLDKAEIRLLDGGVTANRQRLAGLEIRLNGGVKTYWRMPGDSGLPPVFDFSASQNVASVDVKWPIPSRFDEADGSILGFKDRVIFPFIVIPKNPDAPVMLAVTADFGLCDTLCLPAKAELSRALDGSDLAKAEIGQFLALVPKAGSVNGSVQPALIALVADEKSLVLNFASKQPVTDVILEAPGSWYFGRAAITPDGEGHYRAAIPIEQKPSSAGLGGLALTITALVESGATETRVTLGASGSIQ